MTDHPDAQQFTCDHADAGGRLDAALARHMNVSTNEARRILGRATVRVDGRRATHRDKGRVVHLRTVIEVIDAVRDEDAIVIPTPHAPLRVLAEVDGLVIVDKPAGMPVHPLQPDETGTLLNAAVGRWPEMMGVGEGGLRSGVVHRLDVDTSGTLAIATTQAGWNRGRAAIESHTAVKRYHAIVQGKMQGAGREFMRLAVTQHRPALVRVVADPQHAPSGARQCDLQWRAIESLPDHTLVEIELGTGFLHQIRVMMAAMGHAVMGDTLYGEPSDEAPRQMLHAHELTMDDLTARAAYPPDFVTVLDKLRRA